MARSEAESILEAVEANYRAVLYEARWNEQTACQIVPKLIALLDSEDRDVLHRALNAFVTLAMRGSAAVAKIVPHLRSDDSSIAQSAVCALGRVSLEQPDLAIGPLMNVADVPGLEKPAMQALINFGAAAKRAAPVFVRAFADRSAEIRLLALRGLAETEADVGMVAPVLRQAAADKSKRVREYAAKKFPTASAR